MPYSALAQAVRWGLIARNPAAAIDRPRAGGSETVIRALSADEVAALLAAARETWLYEVILLAVATGLRRGELLALRWSDLDLESGLLSVNRAIEETGAGIGFKAPKTARSRRTLPLPQIAVEALRLPSLRPGGAQADARPGLLRCGPRLRDPRGQALVSLQLRPGLADLQGALTALPSASTTCGTRTPACCWRWASTRRSCRSVWVKHSMTMTMDVYSHLLPGVQEAAVAKFEETLGSVLRGVC